MNNTILITSIGWEPRYILGLENTVQNLKLNITQAIVFHPVLFQSTTNQALQKTETILSKKNIYASYIDINLPDHVIAWKTVESALKDAPRNGKFILDITTMSRHLIWLCLHFLENLNSYVKCIYYRPESYGNWLSGDNGKSKLLFRHSGVAYPDRKTCLVLFSGFDADRTNQIIDTFEPAKIILIVQSGDRFDNQTRCITTLTGRSENNIELLDAYTDIETVTQALYKKTKSEIETYNVVAATVGPRISSIALYKLNKLLPQVGLSYTDSSVYNNQYSIGIDISSPYYADLSF
jgi:hypothetical protein